MGELQFNPSNIKFNYMMLSRLKMDCEYHLRGEGFSERALWSGSARQQIANMRTLWEGFKPSMKPEWLTAEDIDRFEKEMNEKLTRRNHK